MQVTIPEAKTRLSQLIKSAQRGEDVVIASHGEPVARLAPVNHVPRPAEAAGRASVILDWLAHHEIPSGCVRSADEIDTAIEGERSAWD